jgi:hypothetical protein
MSQMMALESSLNDESNARLLLLLMDAIMHVDIKSLVCVCEHGLIMRGTVIWKRTSKGGDRDAANVMRVMCAKATLSG